jgi:hypothetical protein
MSNRIIAAAFILAGIVVQTPGIAAQLPVAAVNAAVSTTTVALDPEAAARRSWREIMAEQSASGQGKGCFHATYPDYFWKAVACSTAGQPSSHPTPNQIPDHVPGPQEGGSTGDYVALSQNGLITHVAGTFFRASGITSEENYDTNARPTGSNDYGLQINTNWSLPTGVYNSTSLPTATPAACQGIEGCQIWQQFIDTSDYNGLAGSGHGELFMQYWLFNYSSLPPSKATCPSSNWQKSPGKNNGTDCHRNSRLQSVPVAVPVADLAETRLSSTVENGTDAVYFSYGADAWAVIDSDSFDKNHPDEGGVGIASIWQGVEFNIVGNESSSQAVFNEGTVLGVTVNVRDSSNLPLLCLNDSDPRIGYVGTTGESNNLGLGPCRSTIANGYSAVQFLEGSGKAFELAVIQQIEGVATSAPTEAAASVGARPSLN